MRIIRALIRLTAAYLLCFFVDIMLAAAGGGIMRAICAVCTAAVLVCLMADIALKEAGADVKSLRRGVSVSRGGVFAAGAAVTLPSLISWILLCISALSGSFGYYGLHKLLNPAFMQFYNIIEPDASSSALSSSELIAMLPPVFVPAAAYLLPYFAAMRKKNSDTQ